MRNEQFGDKSYREEHISLYHTLLALITGLGERQQKQPVGDPGLRSFHHSVLWMEQAGTGNCLQTDTPVPKHVGFN